MVDHESWMASTSWEMMSLAERAKWSFQLGTNVFTILEMVDVRIQEAIDLNNFM